MATNRSILPGAYTLSQTSMSIAQAKANFSSLITGVEKKQSPITISRRGVPVAMVVPFPSAPRPMLRDSMAGTVRELGDIVGPIGEEWTVKDPEEDDEDMDEP